MYRGISRRLCSLQEMDQLMNDCHVAWNKCLWFLEAIKLTPMPSCYNLDFKDFKITFPHNLIHQHIKKDK